MGAWGTGPCDSDLAADFVDRLEGLTPQKVISVLERALQRVTNSGARVDGGDGAEAVASAALVASTIPDRGIAADPDDGPGEPLAELPLTLRAGSEMLAGWVEGTDAAQWRHEVQLVTEEPDTVRSRTVTVPDEVDQGSDQAGSISIYQEFRPFPDATPAK
ncbi:DUF4259 domain-containing protein [Streptomyces sp. NPDC093970]|uniref:DUF4259 domain-containing protein n=1 Tax=Streptomyces sp. NPDC093970 TaxID=3155076 RepID=UPI00342E4D26